MVEESGPLVDAEADPILLLRRAARFTGGSGIVFAVLSMISFLAVPRDDDSYFVSFFRENDSTTQFAALYVFPFAGIAFIWFIVSLRMWIPARTPRRVNALLSNVQLVSGVVFLVLFFSAAAALSVSSVTVGNFDGEAFTVNSVAFPQYGNALFFIFASRMGAMFVFSTTSIAKQTEIFPTWFIYTGYVVGTFLLLSSSFNQALFFVFPLWILALGILVLVHFSHLSRHGLDEKIKSIKSAPIREKP